MKEDIVAVWKQWGEIADETGEVIITDADLPYLHAAIAVLEDAQKLHVTFFVAEQDATRGEEL